MQYLRKTLVEHFTRFDDLIDDALLNMEIAADNRERLTLPPWTKGDWVCLYCMGTMADVTIWSYR